MGSRKFWQDGIRFECQGSGKCCVSHGGAGQVHGHVYLTLEDRRRLANRLGVATATFTRRYCDKTDGYFHLKSIRGPCEFLAGKSCSVYEARPAQCRTWPFWPENMNARSWNSAVKSFCPGVGKGKLYSASEIEAQLAMDPVNPYRGSV